MVHASGQFRSASVVFRVHAAAGPKGPEAPADGDGSACTARDVGEAFKPAEGLGVQRTLAVPR